MSAHQLVYRRDLQRADPVRHRTGAAGQGQGHLRFRFDPEARRARSRSASPRACATRPILPSIPNRRFLYCVNEFKEFEGKASGAVSAFRIDRKTGALTFLNTKASHGTDPCHLIVDKTRQERADRQFRERQRLRAADQARRIARRRELISSSIRARASIRARQAGPHAHAVDARQANRFVFVPDLGMDKVMIYALRRDAASSRRTAPALDRRRRPAPVHDSSSCTRAERSPTSSTSSTRR